MLRPSQQGVVYWALGRSLSLLECGGSPPLFRRLRPHRRRNSLFIPEAIRLRSPVNPSRLYRQDSRPGRNIPAYTASYL